MRHRGLLMIGVLIAVTSTSLYAIYSSVQQPQRHEGLGSLLKAGEGAQVAEYDGEGRDMIVNYLKNTSEWTLAQSFLEDKGFVIDEAAHRAYQAKIGGAVLSILRASTKISADMSMGEIILILDEADNVSAWIMVTNLPPEMVSGADHSARSIPVYVWSNGMPVFYVHFYHLIGGLWMPYHYWWHDSHNHPNWYYSYYNYWWWYYRWYNVDWPFWYDWYFSWYYHERFYYWSTWFPMGEPLSAILLLIPLLVVYRRLS